MIRQKLFLANEIDKIKTAFADDSNGRLFLVRGKSSYKNSGAEQFIKQNFDANKIDSFSDFNTNPQISDLKRGIGLFKKENYKGIIAIGGGSVIDMAKLISVFAHQLGDIEDYVTGTSSLLETKTQLLAIPTTSGSGAEATHFSVLYINKNKYSIASNSLLPNYVYVNSKFSQNANSYLTACSGIDAFAQAIESVWSVNCNNESKKYALKAINIIWNNLHDAVHKNSSSAKQQLALASYNAGKAINITKTTAPHAFSYAFTSYYNIPHGHAVALSLPFFFDFNANVTNTDCMDKLGADKVKERINEILEVLSIKTENIHASITKFIESLGLNTKIETLIPNFESQILIDNINTERLNNNPRRVTGKTIEAFLSN